VIEEARKRFGQFMAGDQRALHPDIRGPVFDIVIKYGDTYEFDTVFKHYRNTKTADQKIAALSAIAYTRNTKLLRSLLELSLNPEEVRPQDIIHLYRVLAENTSGRRTVLEFVMQHYNQLAKHCEANPSILSTVVKCACMRFSTFQDADRIASFFAERDHHGIERVVEQSLERVRSNAAWLMRAQDEVANWLKQHVYVN
jgi:aminopeptidase 2